MTQPVYTVAEVAGMLRCSRSTIHRAVKAGELDHVRVLGVVRIPASALPASLALPHVPAAAVAADPAPGSAAVAAVSAASGVAGSLPDPGDTPAGHPTLDNGGS